MRAPTLAQGSALRAKVILASADGEDVRPWCGTQRYTPIRRIDEDALTASDRRPPSHYGRYGYRRIPALLSQAGFQVGKDRVQRISAGQAAPARKAVAHRWLVRAASAGAHQIMSGAPTS